MSFLKGFALFLAALALCSADDVAPSPSAGTAGTFVTLGTNGTIGTVEEPVPMPADWVVTGVGTLHILTDPMTGTWSISGGFAEQLQIDTLNPDAEYIETEVDTAIVQVPPPMDAGFV